MATTCIRPINGSKNKTIATILRTSENYYTNPEKTHSGELVSTYECSVSSFVDEVVLSKKLYTSITGKSREPEDDVLFYTVRHSYKPGEVTAEKANELTFELAKRITGGNHQFLVTTHVNTEVIHSDIIFNSTTLDCSRKFNNEKNSYIKVRKHSDEISRENNLPVVENPKPGNSKTYKEYIESKKGTSWKQTLRDDIDSLIAPCNTFDELLKTMRKKGYEIKRRGKFLRFKAPGMEKVIRLKAETLGEDYSEARIKERIITKEVYVSASKKTTILKDDNEIKRFIDISTDKFKNNFWLTRWAQTNNLKTSSKVYNFTIDNKIGAPEELDSIVKEKASKFDSVSFKISDLDVKLKSNKTLQTHIVNFAKTKAVYDNYLKSRHKEKYYANHCDEILIHEASKRAFKSLNVKKIPSMSELKIQNSNMTAERSSLYSEYKLAKSELTEIQNIQNNLSTMLNKEQNQLNEL